LENSTLTKAPAKSKVKQENESIMKHVIELNEHVAHIMGTLKTQAEMLKSHHDLLERVRTRMGL